MKIEFPMFDLQVIRSMAICTKQEQINTVNVQLLIFRTKNLAGWMGGWMDGWIGGWKGKPG